MTFEDREKAFENKYKLDEELKFKAEARLARLFGEWVGGLLGYTDVQLTDYAKAMAVAQLDEPGNDDILAKAEADLIAAGQTVPRHVLEAKVIELEQVARQQVLGEKK